MFSHFYEGEEENVNQTLLEEIGADPIDESEVDSIEADAELNELLQP
jgi:hypothetical protein